ncbi:uncharacterized protein LOC121370210 [Gigantopelta aegis]|uniref:uncharacterized protein LOC121370210 n=1 Tax=Gigantopelta aegis TaxID=1735272 RepID=UPI001B88D27D|nr:uncharacterized protein LOC121370210 [Gigantopelta aegis]
MSEVEDEDKESRQMSEDDTARKFCSKTLDQPSVNTPRSDLNCGHETSVSEINPEDETTRTFCIKSSEQPTVSTPRSDLNCGHDTSVSIPRSDLNCGHETSVSTPRSDLNCGHETSVSTPRSDLNCGHETSVNTPRSDLNCEHETSVSTPRSDLNGGHETSVSTPRSDMNCGHEMSVSTPRSDLNCGHETSVSEVSPATPHQDCSNTTMYEMDGQRLFDCDTDVQNNTTYDNRGWLCGEQEKYTLSQKSAECSTDDRENPSSVDPVRADTDISDDRENPSSVDPVRADTDISDANTSHSSADTSQKFYVMSNVDESSYSWHTVSELASTMQTNDSKKRADANVDGEKGCDLEKMSEKHKKSIQWASVLNLLHGDNSHVIDWNFVNTNKSDRECTSLDSRHMSGPSDSQADQHSHTTTLVNHQHSASTSDSVNHQHSTSIAVNHQLSSTSGHTNTTALVDHQHSRSSEDHQNLMSTSSHTSTATVKDHRHMSTSVDCQHSASGHPSTSIMEDHQHSPSTPVVHQHTSASGTSHSDLNCFSDTSSNCSMSVTNPHLYTTHTINRNSDGLFQHGDIQCSPTAQRNTFHSTAEDKELLHEKMDKTNIKYNVISPHRATKRHWQDTAGFDSNPILDGVKTPCLNPCYAAPVLPQTVDSSAKSSTKSAAKPLMPFFFGAARGSVILPDNLLSSVKGTPDGQLSIQYNVNDPYTQRLNYQPIAAKVSDIHQMIYLLHQSQSNDTKAKKIKPVFNDFLNKDCVPITICNRSYICTRKALSNRTVKDLIDTASLLPGAESSDSELDETSEGTDEEEDDDAATLKGSNSVCSGDKIHAGSNSNGPFLPVQTSAESVTGSPLKVSCDRTQLMHTNRMKRDHTDSTTSDGDELVCTAVNSVSCSHTVKATSDDQHIQSVHSAVELSSDNSQTRSDVSWSLLNKSDSLKESTDRNSNLCDRTLMMEGKYEQNSSIQKTNMVLCEQGSTEDFCSKSNYLCRNQKSSNLKSYVPVRADKTFETKDAGQSVMSTHCSSSKTDLSLLYGLLRADFGEHVDRHGRNDGTNMPHVSANTLTVPLDLRVDHPSTSCTEYKSGSGKMSVVPDHLYQQTDWNMNSKVPVSSDVYSNPCPAYFPTLHCDTLPPVSASFPPGMSNFYENNITAMMSSSQTHPVEVAVPAVSGVLGQNSMQMSSWNQSNCWVNQSVHTLGKDVGDSIQRPCSQQTQHVFYTPSLESVSRMPSPNVQRSLFSNDVSSLNSQASLSAVSYTRTTDTSRQQPVCTVDPQSLMYQCSEEDAEMVQMVRSDGYSRESKPKPRHFLISELRIGNYKFSCSGTNGDRTSKIKILFSRRKLVYELQLNETTNTVLSCIKQLAAVEVPFETIVHLWGHDKHVIVELSKSPLMFLGTRVSDSSRPKLHYSHMPCYDRSKHVDVTGGYLPIAPYHFITLRSSSVDKVKQCFAEFSDRFCEMLLRPLIVNPQKKLENHKQTTDVTMHLKSQNSTQIQNMPPSSTADSNNNKIVPSEPGCSCVGGCRSKMCPCRKQGTVCSDCCVCYSCDNPLNMLDKMGVAVDMACLDACLMQNIYQETDLEKVLMREIVLQCCDVVVKLKECVPGPIHCPNKPQCRASYRFSWCKGEVCNEVTNKRNHCHLCQKCVQPMNQHCQCQ